MLEQHSGAQELTCHYSVMGFIKPAHTHYLAVCCIDAAGLMDGGRGGYMMDGGGFGGRPSYDAGRGSRPW